MKIFVGVTDFDWFSTLRQRNFEEINFWKPSGQISFKVLQKGELFLFKLHHPNNFIVGGGFFLKYASLPASLAWDAFGIANGTLNLSDLKSRIFKYRKIERLQNPDPEIGCIILSMPFFFEKQDWIPIPDNWSSNIVTGKTYYTDDYIGSRLFEQVQNRLTQPRLLVSDAGKDCEYTTINPTKIATITDQTLGSTTSMLSQPRYGKEQIIQPRIGQGSFKVYITEAYNRRCTITGEKTLPVLEAAHIKPYSMDGPHELSNGLLLRSDFHTLFDRGYVTVNEDFVVEVSHRIKEDFGNGREYYAHHGQPLLILPDKPENRPGKEYLRWHNEQIYLG